MGILGRYYFFVGAVASCLILMCGAVAAQNDGRYLDRALPEAWEPDTLFVQKLPVEDRWWKELGDVRLDSLISVAVANNYEKAPDLAAVAKKGYTTKGSGHGTGLASYRRIVARCRGCAARTYLKDGMFVQELHIPAT